MNAGASLNSGNDRNGELLAEQFAVLSSLYSSGRSSVLLRNPLCSETAGRAEGMRVFLSLGAAQPEQREQGGWDTGAGGAENDKAPPRLGLHSAWWRWRSAAALGRAGGRFASRKCPSAAGCPCPARIHLLPQEPPGRVPDPGVWGTGSTAQPQLWLPRRAPSLSAGPARQPLRLLCFVFIARVPRARSGAGGDAAAAPCPPCPDTEIGASRVSCGLVGAGGCELTGPLTRDLSPEYRPRRGEAAA